MAEVQVVDEVEVTLPSGGTFSASVHEAEFISDLSRRYTTEFAFQSSSDLSDLDRVVIFEALVRRWGRWLSRRVDDTGLPIDEKTVGDRISNTSSELRQLKKLLGIDKVAREKAKGEGSVPHYIANLLERAKAFGVHRERQLDKALELANQLSSLVVLHRNCTEDERRSLHVTQGDLIEWIETVYIPEFEAIDAHFRANEQRFWVRDL
jgi:hypothetical protein